MTETLLLPPPPRTQARGALASFPEAEHDEPQGIWGDVFSDTNKRTWIEGVVDVLGAVERPGPPTTICVS